MAHLRVTSGKHVVLFICKMAKYIKKWTFRLVATALLIAGLLLIIILNPFLTYAGKTTRNNYTIFHSKPLSPVLNTRLQQATTLIAGCELYHPNLKLDVCLNDGSPYPAIIRAIGGQAFARGFYNKVVLFGNADVEQNFVELNGYKWNLTQLLAHEMTHCYQFDKRGFRHSNPVAHIPQWKWEGYPEYVARQSSDQKELLRNLDRLIATEKTDNNGWIQFADSTGTVIDYYKSWLLVQYCMDIRKRSYAAILADTTGEKRIREQMMLWYSAQKADAN